VAAAADAAAVQGQDGQEQLRAEAGERQGGGAGAGAAVPAEGVRDAAHLPGAGELPKGRGQRAGAVHPDPDGPHREPEGGSAVGQREPRDPDRGGAQDQISV